MKRIARKFGGIVTTGIALTVAGCGPSMQNLIAGNHFREATCLAVEHSDDGEHVAATITRALDPQVFIEVMPDAVVAAAAPGAPPDLPTRTIFLHVRLSTNEIPIDHLDVALVPAGDVAIHPTTREALALLTSEHAPPSHTEVVTHGFENFVSGVMSVLTLGIVDPVQRGPTTREVPASDVEWENAAPNATRLNAVFGGSGCTPHQGGSEEAPHIGMSCDASFLVERAGNGSAALDFDVMYGADRLAHDPELRLRTDDDHDWMCRAKSRIHVALGPSATLPEKTATMFGGKYRALRELDADARSATGPDSR